MNIGGKKIPPWALWGGGTGAVLAGWIYLKHRGSSSSGAATGTTAATVTDPSTGQTYPAGSVDSVTGMTYASEIASYGSVAAAQAAVSSGSGYGLPGGYGGYGGTAGYPTSNVGSTAPVQSYATNAQWAQAVTAGLAALGYDSQTVAAALGLYFAQHPLSADQASVVQAAIAEYGPPPQGTYPIIPVPSSGGGTPPPVQHPPGGTRPPKPAVPHVTAQALSRTSIRISWTPDPGANSYVHYLTYQGAEIGKGTTGTGTASAVISGLSPGHTYTPHVIASGPSGSASGQGPGVRTPN